MYLLLVWENVPTSGFSKMYILLVLQNVHTSVVHNSGLQYVPTSNVHNSGFSKCTYFWCTQFCAPDQTSWGNSTKCAISQKIVNRSWVHFTRCWRTLYIKRLPFENPCLDSIMSALTWSNQCLGGLKELSRPLDKRTKSKLVDYSVVTSTTEEGK